MVKTRDHEFTQYFLKKYLLNNSNVCNFLWVTNANTGAGRIDVPYQEGYDNFNWIAGI